MKRKTGLLCLSECIMLLLFFFLFLQKDFPEDSIYEGEEIYTPPEYKFRLGSTLEFGAGLC